MHEVAACKYTIRGRGPSINFGPELSTDLGHVMRSSRSHWFRVLCSSEVNRTRQCWVSRLTCILPEQEETSDQCSCSEAIVPENSILNWLEVTTKAEQLCPPVAYLFMVIMETHERDNVRVNIQITRFFSVAANSSNAKFDDPLRCYRSSVYRHFALIEQNNKKSFVKFCSLCSSPQHRWSTTFVRVIHFSCIGPASHAPQTISFRCEAGVLTEIFNVSRQRWRYKLLF